MASIAENEIEHCIFQLFLILKNKMAHFKPKVNSRTFRREQAQTSLHLPKRSRLDSLRHPLKSASSPIWPLQPLLSSKRNSPIEVPTSKDMFQEREEADRTTNLIIQGIGRTESDLTLLSFQFLFHFFYVMKAISLYPGLTILHLSASWTTFRILCAS